jgi:predicted glycogen debranching enzyme
MKYCNKGIMPNLFPEGEDNPMYNTVDASLLFVNAVYSYYKASNDVEFVKEAYSVIEEIIDWYMKGTDFHIHMDEDGLIMAGGGLEQVTWMDVRFGDILPTPRHGKPVEINAYWYNALMIMDEFSKLLNKVDTMIDYVALADKVKASFNEFFWNEKDNCLKDLYSGTDNDYQIRCNQIWAASMPYCMLSEERANAVITKVFEELYTPIGLRSLSPKDKDFKPFYGGKHFDRDMAYHQGTTWGFPLGAYYLAYLQWAKDKESAKRIVKRQLNGLEAGLREGCVGHIAEIYSGLHPYDSKGCFAQAWSVGELLRVYEMLEKM